MTRKLFYSNVVFWVVPVFAAACLLISFNRSFSQTPDWSTTIAPIIYNHCSHCHHEDAIAPFPLMSYEDAITWGLSMQTQVNANLMPPWPPDPYYNHLKDENVLSAYEISAINSWVDNGMPSGDLSLAPPAPVFNGGSNMLNPDEVVHLPYFTVPDVGDVYWRFTNQSGYTEAKYLNSVEYVAGNPSIMHHLTVGLDGSGLAYQDDLDYPGPGCPSGFGSNPWVSIFMSQSEGRVVTLPTDMGFKVHAGDDYVTDVHYHTDALNEIDSSKMNIKFCTVANPRAVETDKWLYGQSPSLIDGPFEIPANTIQTFHLQTEVFTEDESLVGLGPHSHLICKSWKVYMVIPSGDTIPLISIPNWDFNWQGSYLLTKVIKIPQGSQIFGTVVYDNTVNNPHNPNNPPEDMEGGNTQSAEMAQVHFWWMEYQPGDEDIILDSAFYIATGGAAMVRENYLSIYPNPASQSATIEFAGTDAVETSFTLYNHLGELLLTSIEKPFAGKRSIQLDCTKFPPGMYLFTARSGVEVSSQKFVIQK